MLYLTKTSKEISVARCWAHCRRKFAEIIKATTKDTVLTPAQEIAAEAVKRIDKMYHLDNKYKEASPEERLRNRKDMIESLTDDFFVWIKEQLVKTIASSALKQMGSSHTNILYIC